MPLSTLIDGLGFAEGLRWREGKLWFSDFLTRKIQTVDLAGRLTDMAFVPGQPSGLGFMPDGTPRVVSMLDRRLLTFASEQLGVVADLRHVAVGPCNDMIVDSKGNAYIGSLGYELWYEPLPPSTRGPLIRVDPQGAVSVAAPDMRGPNGMALLAGEKTLVIAETHACRLTAFDVAEDGSLSGRRLFADLGDIHPDGICANARGDIWVAGLYASQFMLVGDGGKVLEAIETPGRWAVACALGGETRNRLFCATATVAQPTDMRRGRARSAIEFLDVEVPAA